MINFNFCNPDWSLSEPNIASAKRKNNEGTCWVHKCNNKLKEPKVGYVIGYCCEKHVLEFEKQDRELERDIHRQMDEQTISSLKAWGLI